MTSLNPYHITSAIEFYHRSEGSAFNQLVPIPGHCPLLIQVFSGRELRGVRGGAVKRGTYEFAFRPEDQSGSIHLVDGLVNLAPPDVLEINLGLTWTLAQTRAMIANTPHRVYLLSIENGYAPYVVEGRLLHVYGGGVGPLVNVGPPAQEWFKAFNDSYIPLDQRAEPQRFKTAC